MELEHSYSHLCYCKKCTEHEKELKNKINNETNKEDYDIKSSPIATKEELDEQGS